MRRSTIRAGRAGRARTGQGAYAEVGSSEPSHGGTSVTCNRNGIDDLRALRGGGPGGARTSMHMPAWRAAQTPRVCTCLGRSNVYVRAPLDRTRDTLLDPWTPRDLAAGLNPCSECKATKRGGVCAHDRPRVSSRSPCPPSCACACRSFATDTALDLRVRVVCGVYLSDAGPAGPSFGLAVVAGGRATDAGPISNSARHVTTFLMKVPLTTYPPPPLAASRLTRASAPHPRPFGVLLCASSQASQAFSPSKSWRHARSA